MIHFLHVNGALAICLFYRLVGGATCGFVTEWHSSVLSCPLSKNRFCACLYVHIEIKIDAVYSCHHLHTTNVCRIYTRK